MRILAAQGFDETKMKLFRYNIDIGHYNYREPGKSFLRNLAGIDGGIDPVWKREIFGVFDSGCVILCEIRDKGYLVAKPREQHRRD